MRRLLVTAIAIGLIIAITSIIQIALELAPRDYLTPPYTQPYFITVTIPVEREIIVSPTTVTITLPVETVERTITEYVGAHTVTETIMYTMSYVHFITYSYPVEYTITKTERVEYTKTVTETTTLINYAEIPVVTMQFTAPSASEIVLYPDNASFTIVRIHDVRSINMLDMGLRSLVCSNCNARLTRFGDLNAIEVSLQPGHQITLEVDVNNPIQLERGALWIYIPGLREEVDIEKIYVKVENTIVAISKDLLITYFLSAGRLYFVRLAGIPRINGLTLNLRAYHDKVVTLMFVSPNYRPIQVRITPPASLLNFKLRNGYCPYARYGYRPPLQCVLEIYVRVSPITGVLEYRAERYMHAIVHVDPDAFFQRGLIVIVAIDPVDLQLDIDHIPLEPRTEYTVYVTIR